nr:sterile alpha motif domain-containing protein 9-like [Danio rerio]|eukprot:XP_021327787.1 sterile alpha motif domain-containing protein 9-like [Danio rerio]
MLEINVDREDADLLYNERINGATLLLLEATDFRQLSLSMNAIKLIVHNVDLLKQKTQQQNDMASLSCSMKPYPFNRFNTAHRYRENTTLDVTETGPIDLIQPCHEFKGFTNTTEEDRMKKYTYEVIRFAAACMNSRTNGTIHFGVADKPHGQILGVNIPKTDDFDVQQSHAIERHFKWEKNVQIAKMCIKPPRFVEVLKVDMMSSGKYVIEVDIEPSSNVCQDLHFNTYDLEKNNKNLKNKDKMSEPKKNNESKSFFIRDGSSSKNIITSDSLKEVENYLANMAHLSQLRKEAEEKHLSVVKTSVQGSKLCEMITGGTQSLDRSHFKSYIVVANKSHPVQLENLRFLLHMDLVAVLDFDPESAEHGLNKLFEERKTNVHSPTQYKITGAVEDIADKLKLTKNTSWVFCNGGINNESPSDADKWLIEKGSSVHDVISFLCRRDVLPHKKFLTVFLLLNQVNDRKDPLLETLKFFLQELKGENQILCITDNKTSYTYWKDLIDVADISKRCIYELSFAEVNGTVLSLWSENRKSSRFLPCGGGSNVVLSKKIEESLEMLSILCVNQCEGGNEDKQHHEKIFYKGGKVSWWNFYFSEQPGSMPFIKRDKFDYIVNTIIPDICSQKTVCEFFNIFHLPGCGGTTLAMHVLWTLKKQFRCAVLKDSTGDYTAAAEQVVQLLTYETNEQPKRLPVLLLIDDFQDISDVKKLKLQIEEECQKQNISSKSPQVIIVNCMRVETHELTDRTDNSVFIGNTLSKKEQELFEEKLKEFRKTKMNTKTFYGFMILMTNFSSEYIQSVVKKTLKDFNFEHKHAQLFAVLVLLHVYSSNAVLSVSTCEEFLGLQPKVAIRLYKVEDEFERFSNLLTRCKVNSKVNFEGVRVIHSCIAKQCLQELSASHGVTKAEITNILLTTELFYEYTLGKQKLRQDVHNMLVKRQYSAEVEGSLFSPLIQDIMKETPGTQQIILHNAEKCLKKDAYISQLLARYYYIKKQDFLQAMYWAKKAKSQLTENSYICDTEFQVRMHELKHAVYKDKDNPIKPENLDEYLTLAQKASEACKETQKTADKEAKHQLDKRRVNRGYKNYQTYNTAGHLSHLQTAVTVTEMLQKTPLYAVKDTRNNCLSQVLMGKITIEDLPSKNPRLKPYIPPLPSRIPFAVHLAFKKNVTTRRNDAQRKICDWTLGGFDKCGCGREVWEKSNLLE